MKPILTKNLKVKIFGTGITPFEVHEWFDTNPNLEILDIQYAGKGGDRAGYALIYHYREIEEDSVLPFEDR